jgi:hypothetical protein
MDPEATSESQDEPLPPPSVADVILFALYFVKQWELTAEAHPGMTASDIDQLFERLARAPAWLVAELAADVKNAAAHPPRTSPFGLEPHTIVAALRLTAETGTVGDPGYDSDACARALSAVADMPVQMVTQVAAELVAEIRDALHSESQLLFIAPKLEALDLNLTSPAIRLSTHEDGGDEPWVEFGLRRNRLEEALRRFLARSLRTSLGEPEAFDRVQKALDEASRKKLAPHGYEGIWKEMDLKHAITVLGREWQTLFREFMPEDKPTVLRWFYVVNDSRVGRADAHSRRIDEEFVPELRHALRKLEQSLARWFEPPRGSSGMGTSAV